MYMNYTLSRSFDEQPHTSFSITDDDAINAAHMLAAGFNTMNRNFMGDFVLAVVDKKAGVVHYDGKTETISRGEPWSASQTFTFEPSEGDADTILTLFGNGGTPTFTAAGKMSPEARKPSAYAHVARSVLEEAYADYMGIRERMYEAGVETIPVSAGVDELRSIIDAREERFRERAEADEAARAEMISFVKRAHAKKLRIQAAGEPRPELDDRWRGMLDVLAKFLVVTGEADPDEGHAVARRLCEVDDSEF